MSDTHPVGADQEDTGQARRQVDALLAKFPGPVTLHVTLNRRLTGLVFGVCGTALFIWFWMTPDRYRWYDWIMEPVGILFFAGLTIRAVILLIFPAHASLTLDADGFKINHVFHHIRRSWRDVSDFGVEERYWRHGKLRHVMYDVLDDTVARRGTKKKAHYVPEFYGRPRLHGEALARLLNAWRRRALALPETSVPVVPRADQRTISAFTRVFDAQWRYARDTAGIVDRIGSRRSHLRPHLSC